MKAIVLAAGKGTRLGPLTKDRPKALVPLRGRPLLERHMEVLRREGIGERIVVGGYRAEDLRPYATRLYVNPRFETSNMVESLFCARREFDDDLILAYGDILYEPRVLRAVTVDRSPIAVAVDRRWRELWEWRMSDPLKDAETLKLTPEGNIRELGKKPRRIDEIEGQYLGLIRVSRAFLPELTRIYDTLDRSATYDGQPFSNLYMTSFLQGMIDRGHPIRAVPVDGGWLEVDTPEDIACYESDAFLKSGLVDFSAI